MSADDDVLAAVKQSLEMTKLRGEVELQSQKLEGREKAPAWQRAQTITAAVGVFLSVCTLVVSFANYRKLVQDSRRSDLQKAVEHYQNGWLTGIVELSAHGAEGLQTLVYGVDGAKTMGEKVWPRITVATLDELAKRKKDLTPAQQTSLTAALQENRDALDRLLQGIEAKAPQPPTAAEDDHLADLVCVQSKLLVIVEAPTDPDWVRIYKTARVYRPGLPDC